MSWWLSCCRWSKRAAGWGRLKSRTTPLLIFTVYLWIGIWERRWGTTAMLINSMLMTVDACWWSERGTQRCPNGFCGGNGMLIMGRIFDVSTPWLFHGHSDSFSFNVLELWWFLDAEGKIWLLTQPFHNMYIYVYIYYIYIWYYIYYLVCILYIILYYTILYYI